MIIEAFDKSNTAKTLWWLECFWFGLVMWLWMACSAAWWYCVPYAKRVGMLPILCFHLLREKLASPSGYRCESREIGRSDVGTSTGFPSFKRDIIRAIFQMLGTLLVRRVSLMVVMMWRMKCRNHSPWMTSTYQWQCFKSVAELSMLEVLNVVVFTHRMSHILIRCQ